MLSDEIRDVLLGTEDFRAKVRGERVTFRCPRHDDHRPSAWTGGGAWGCWVCGHEESIVTLADEIGVPLVGGRLDRPYPVAAVTRSRPRPAPTLPVKRGHPRASVPAADYTVEMFAQEKGLLIDYLRDLGLETDRSGRYAVVRIPYYGTSGQLLRYRFRSPTSTWWEGQNRPIYPYGLERIPAIREAEAVTLVEGETDTIALSICGIPALGLPGAATWNDGWTTYLDGINTVHAVAEPDAGGATLVGKLAGSPLADRVRIVEMPAGLKDARELYLQYPDPVDFAVVWEEAIADSIPIPETLPR